MKNRILCILFAVLLCAALCGCGMDRTGNRPGTDNMDILPDVTPMISPDASDGVVTDQDGVIGNGHADGADQNNDGYGNGTTAASPAPSTSPSPDANGIQGIAPTTVPGPGTRP